MMTKEGSTKIVNFMTRGTGVLVLGFGHMSYRENVLIYNLLYSKAQVRQSKYKVMTRNTMTQASKKDCKPYLYPQKKFVSVFYSINIFNTIYYFKPTNFNFA